MKLRKPKVVALERKTVTMQGRDGPRTVRRWQITLAFGDTLEKLAVSKLVADWLRGIEPRTRVVKRLNRYKGRATGITLVERPRKHDRCRDCGERTYVPGFLYCKPHQRSPVRLGGPAPNKSSRGNR